MKKQDTILLKICGLKEAENIRDISSLHPDFMGFIFYPKSPRYVVGHLDSDVLEKIPRSIRKVGVFVNEEIDKVLDMARSYHLDMLQLHGEESPEYCRRCREKYPVIKAFPMSADFNFNELERYKDHADYFLFDTKTEKYGGSGIRFNWNILQNYKSEKPYFLSGGIGVEDIENALQGNLPPEFILDINSKVEIKPGLKDIGKINEIKEKLIINRIRK